MVQFSDSRSMACEIRFCGVIVSAATAMFVFLNPNICMNISAFDEYRNIHADIGLRNINTAAADMITPHTRISQLSSIYHFRAL
jgi:hypothetical protein